MSHKFPLRKWWFIYNVSKLIPRQDLLKSIHLPNNLYCFPCRSFWLVPWRNFNVKAQSMVIYLYCEVLSYCNLLGECKNKINNNYYAILKVLYKHPTSKYNNFNVSTYTPTIAKCKVAPILKAVVNPETLCPNSRNKCSTDWA